MAKIIDGKLIAAKVREEIKEKTALLIEQGVRPGLAVIIVGEDSASQVYVRNKIKACAEVGFYSEMQNMYPESLKNVNYQLTYSCKNSNIEHMGYSAVLFMLPCN
jgi:methylenetetrahydrofolate dehydrogenase (NADP+)/methenyltetrahydrofolate cyclohydrolase